MIQRHVRIANLVAARVLEIESTDDAMYRVLCYRLMAARVEALARRERVK